MTNRTTARTTKRPAIAVLGAGNLGQAMAADLALKGVRVSLWNRTAAKLDRIVERGGIEIEIEGAVSGFGALSTVSSDLAPVVEEADIVMVTAPTSAHAAIATQLAPLVRATQLVVLHPGHTFGAVEVANIFYRANRVTPPVAEIQTSVLTARALEMGRTHVSAIKNYVPIAVLPARAGDVLEPLLALYPSLAPVENIYKTGLDNLNTAFHPTIALFNLTRIEKSEPFLFYKEGITPAVGRFIKKLDAERCAVAKALGVEPLTAFDWIGAAYDVSGDDIYSRVQDNEAYDRITGPTTLQSRVFLEDLPTGLVPIASLGRHLGVPTPMIDSVITIVSALYERDFRSEGRTIERLGLDTMSVEELHRFAREGYGYHSETNERA